MTETPQEIVDRELRDFKRYEGDGLQPPVTGPLPIGDPNSGPHNIKPKNLRAALRAPLEAGQIAIDAAAEAAQSAIDADDAATRAEAAAADVEFPVSYAPQTLTPEQRAQARQNIGVASGSGELFKTVADLLADDNEVIGYEGDGAEVTVEAGDVIVAQGFRYEVAASGASDHHVATAGGVKLYVLPGADGTYNILAFGDIGNGVSDDTAIFSTANGAVNAAGGGILYVPDGTYLIDELALKSGVRLVGQSKDGVTIKYSGASITPTPAHPSVVATEQIYKAFIRTENAGNVGTWDESISVENLTVDWDNQDADGYAAVLVWMGNVRGCEVKNLAFAGALPADYSIPTTSVGRGASVFMSYVETGLVEGCTFADEASYEELGIRYYNRDITVRRNKFAGDGPWRHNIEVAAVRDLSGVNEWPKGIVIEDNAFELHGAKQECLSCHDGGDVIFRNNRVVVMDDLVDTTQSGVRSLVKRFDNDDGIVDGFLLVEGNTFDFRDVPSTVKRAFEAVRVWTGNVTVANNIFKGRTDGFDNSIASMELYPWVGMGQSTDVCEGLVVKDNIFELYEYSASRTFQIIKVSANGATISGNILHIKEPVTVSSTGPIFIDLNGSLAPAGRCVTIIGNTSYSTNSSALLVNVRARNAANDFVVIGNVSNCAVTDYLEGTVGGSSYKAGNL